MYYYGNSGYGAGYGYGGAGACAPYVGNTGGCGAAIWIVLFILLVIILGAGCFKSGCGNTGGCCNN